MTEQEEENLDNLAKRLHELMNNEDWNAVLGIREQLAVILPGDPLWYEAMERCMLQYGDLDRCEECLSLAFERDDGDFMLPGLMSTVCKYRGDLAGERKWLERVLVLKPGNTTAISRLAFVCKELGDTGTAVELLETLIRDHPEYMINARRVLAEVLLSAKRPEAAEEQLREAIGICTGIPVLHTELGRILAGKGDHAGALEEYFAALEGDSDNPWRYYDIGDTYLALNDPRNAVTYLCEAKDLGPDIPAIHYDLGLAYLDLGRYGQSIAESRKALDNDPAMEKGITNPGLHATANLGVAHMRLKQYGEAEDCFRKNVALAAPAFYNLGLALYRQGKYGESLRNFQAAADIRPGDAEYRDMLANAFMELGRTDEAKAELEKAVAADATHASAHYDLGLVYSHMEGQENADRALELFEKAIALDGSSWLPYYGAACLHAVAGRKARALNYLNNAVLRGFAEREHLDADKDWDGLREEPEFLKIRGRMPEHPVLPEGI